MAEIPYGHHEPLLKDDGDPYGFILKPENGKKICVFEHCRYCGVLFEGHGMCLDAPIEDEDDSASRYREIKRRHQENLDRVKADLDEE